MENAHTNCRESIEDGRTVRSCIERNKDTYAQSVLEAVVFSIILLVWAGLTFCYLFYLLVRWLRKRNGRSSSSSPSPSSSPVIQSGGYSFMEVVVLSLYILVWVFGIIGTLTEDMALEFCKESRTPVYPPLEANVNPATTELLTVRNIMYHDKPKTVDNVEKVFRSNTQDYKTATLKSIVVYSCPLTAPFKSSTSSVRNYIQRQYLPVDYHSFVVFETSDGRWWALDKMTEGIFVSWGSSLDSVVFYFHKKPRAEPVHMLVKDGSTSSVSDLVRRLRKILKSNKYDLIDKNCQHFSREIFDKFAIDETWELTTPTELISPLKLFSDSGPPLTVIIFTVFVIYELYLLYKESRENYQFVVYTVISVSSVLVYFNDRVQRFWKFRHIVCWMLIGAVLPMEAVLYSPLGTVRKRGTQYGKMWRSGTIFSKFWLPMCYTIVYTYTTYYLIFDDPLLIFLEYGTHLKKHVPSAVISPLLNFVSWLVFEVLTRNVGLNILTWYIPTVMYFSLQY